MPSLAELLKQKLEKEGSESLTSEKKVEPIKDIMEDEKAQISISVGQKNYKIHSNIEICPICKKRLKIIQDKDLNKDEIINWFTDFIKKNKKNFTLDWLRGQKLTFESVLEMRKFKFMKDII